MASFSTSLAVVIQIFPDSHTFLFLSRHFVSCTDLSQIQLTLKSLILKQACLQSGLGIYYWIFFFLFIADIMIPFLIAGILL